MTRSSPVATLRWAAYRATKRLGQLVHPLAPGMPRVAFLHIPKCAGTSLDYAIRRPRGYFDGLLDFDGEVFVSRATEGAKYDFTSPVLWHNTQVASLRFMHYGAPVVSGHFSLHPSALEFAGDYRFVTLLRKPVERWISHYRYAKLGSVSHLGGSMQQTLEDSSLSLREQLDRVIDSPVGLFLGCLQSSMLGGYGLHGAFLASSARAELRERARAALTRFAVVGTLEDLGHFSAKLRASVAPVLDIEKRNATDEKPRPKDSGQGEMQRRIAEFDRLQEQDKAVKALFDEPTRRRVAALCETDQSLYAEVAERT